MYKNMFSDLWNFGNASEYNLFLMSYATDIQKTKQGEKFLDHNQQHKGSIENT